MSEHLILMNLNILAPDLLCRAYSETPQPCKFLKLNCVLQGKAVAISAFDDNLLILALQHGFVDMA